MHLTNHKRGKSQEGGVNIDRCAAKGQTVRYAFCQIASLSD